MAPRKTAPPPSPASADVLDLTRELGAIAALAAEPGRVDDLLARSLEALGQGLPYDLAAVLELEGEELVVRCARGRLADERLRGRVLRLADHPLLRAALEERRTRTLDREDHALGLDPYHGLLPLPDGHACMLVPLAAAERTLGALTFDRERCEPYAPPLVELATVYGQIISLALQAAKQTALLESYRARLEERNRLLEGEVGGLGHAGGRIVGFESPVMRELAATARQVAVTDAPVLITGETGTGKEAPRARDPRLEPARATRPFVKLNCAALPEGLVESELFGHERGAFTGATADRAGPFRAWPTAARCSSTRSATCRSALQAKLLRVLQEGELRAGRRDTHRQGRRAHRRGDPPRPRAGHRARAASASDLLYRLNVFPLACPPLRERAEDIARLARAVPRADRAPHGARPLAAPADALERLRGYRWPGNVRELLNVLERATVLAEGEDLRVSLPEGPAAGRLRRPASRRSPRSSAPTCGGCSRPPPASSTARAARPRSSTSSRRRSRAACRSSASRASADAFAARARLR